MNTHETRVNIVTALANLKVLGEDISARQYRAHYYDEPIKPEELDEWLHELKDTMNELASITGDTDERQSEERVG